MSSAIDERLAQFLNEGKPWEKKPTNIPGVLIQKLPMFKGTAPSLAIEINPVNAAGSFTKRRGIIIRTRSELEEITKLLSNPKVAQLAKNIDEVNPEGRESGSKSSSDMFEI